MKLFLAGRFDKVLDSFWEMRWLNGEYSIFSAVFVQISQDRATAERMFKRVAEAYKAEGWGMKRFVLCNFCLEDVCVCRVPGFDGI